MKRLTLLFVIIGFAVFFSSEIEAQISEDNLYKVNIGDAVKIRVLDHPDLSVVATISSDGSINYPYLGTVYIKGMSVTEIEEELVQKLSEGYVRYPVVTVSMVKSTGRKIYTYGEIRRIGEIPFDDNMTIVRTMSIAGGVSENGRYGKMKVRRKQGKTGEYKDIVESQLDDGVIENKEIEDMMLEPDDILIVERNKTFLIQGEIGSRGRVVLEKRMTVLRALLQSGGVSGNGLYGKIKVRRKQEGKTGDYKDIIESQLDDGVIENKEVEDMLLQPDDILIVERNKTFLIQGEIGSRGRFVLEKGMTVLRALLEAGGVAENGRYGKIKVRRKQEGKTGEYKDIIESQLDDGIIENKEVEDMLLQPDDVLIVEQNETFLIQGEISKRGRFVLEKGMTVLRALLEAGGASENGRYGKIKVRRKQEGKTGEYKDIIESQLDDGIIENKEVEDMLLQPDDILMVERNKTFFIYGEVQGTGKFVLDSDMTVFKAITLAGGFTKWGSGSRVRILRPKDNQPGLETIKVNIDDVLDGDASADMYLKPKDVIVVSTGIF